MCNSKLLTSDASERNIQVINKHPPLKKIPEVYPGRCIDCYFKNRDSMLCDSLPCIEEKIIYVLADNYENGPDVSDGHDCQGFIGGCERCGCPGGDKCTEVSSNDSNC